MKLMTGPGCIFSSFCPETESETSETGPTVCYTPTKTLEHHDNHVHQLVVSLIIILSIIYTV